jgi:hypothetical protein
MLMNDDCSNYLKRLRNLGGRFEPLHSWIDEFDYFPRDHVAPEMVEALDKWYGEAIWAQATGSSDEESRSARWWGAYFAVETTSNLLEVGFPSEITEALPPFGAIYGWRSLFLEIEAGVAIVKTGYRFPPYTRLPIQNPLESVLEWLAFSLENSTFVENPVSWPQWMDRSVWIPNGVEFSGDFAPYCGIPNDLPYLWLTLSKDLKAVERVLTEWFPEGRFDEILRLFERWLTVAKYPPAWLQ